MGLDISKSWIDSGGWDPLVDYRRRERNIDWELEKNPPQTHPSLRRVLSSLDRNRKMGTEN